MQSLHAPYRWAPRSGIYLLLRCVLCTETHTMSLQGWKMFRIIFINRLFYSAYNMSRSFSRAQDPPCTSSSLSQSSDPLQAPRVTVSLQVRLFGRWNAESAFSASSVGSCAYPCYNGWEYNTSAYRIAVYRHLIQPNLGSLCDIYTFVFLDAWFELPSWVSIDSTCAISILSISLSIITGIFTITLCFVLALVTSYWCNRIWS